MAVLSPVGTSSEGKEFWFLGIGFGNPTSLMIESFKLSDPRNKVQQFATSNPGHDSPASEALVVLRALTIRFARRQPDLALKKPVPTGLNLKYQAHYVTRLYHCASSPS